MKNLDIKNSLQGLIKDAPKTPVQVVKPVKTKKRSTKDEDEFHINARIPIDYEKQVKRYCLENDMTIRTFLIEAIKTKLGA